MKERDLTLSRHKYKKINSTQPRVNTMLIGTYIKRYDVKEGTGNTESRNILRNM